LGLLQWLLAIAAEFKLRALLLLAVRIERHSRDGQVFCREDWMRTLDDCGLPEQAYSRPQPALLHILKRRKESLTCGGQRRRGAVIREFNPLDSDPAKWLAAQQLCF
jgi:hypothetical protein